MKLCLIKRLEQAVIQSNPDCLDEYQCFWLFSHKVRSNVNCDHYNLII